MPSARLSLYLVAILAAATLLTVVSTLFTYRNSMRAAQDSLKLQALGIAVSLDASLPRLAPGDSNIFRDIITQSAWEGIAFMALYDREGVTLLHSNGNLIGRKVDDPAIAAAAGSGEPLYGYVTLGTGEEVFMITFPVRGEKADRVLRLALHTFPVEGIIGQARLEAVSTLAVLAILWLLGLFFIKAVRRSEALSSAMAERERLALLGEMASVLAHEIRNPLGSIKGFAQFLLEHPPGAPPGSPEEAARETAEYLNIIVSESRRLEKLTEDLLDYARPVEVRPREFDLAGLVGDVLRAMSTGDGGAPRSPVTVEIPGPLTIETDPDKLRQILTNLLQNAFDAAGPGRPVTVAAGTDRGKVVLTVRDGGHGMDAETLQRAREPFFTTKTQGTGLGLAIVSRLTEALSGTIEMTSTPGEGTTVTLVLPVRPGRLPVPRLNFSGP